MTQDMQAGAETDAITMREQVAALKEYLTLLGFPEPTYENVPHIPAAHLATWVMKVLVTTRKAALAAQSGSGEK